ncbi:hypothetical protein ACUY4R_002200 [Kosakonia sp. BK9b]
MIGSCVILGFIILFIFKGCFLHRILKKEPVYAKAKLSLISRKCQMKKVALISS